jgi:cytochrome d ubiquinol oxidase subunit I
MELVTHTGTHVPVVIGGILADGEVRYGIKIPELASILAGFDPNTEVKGLDTVPPENRPPATVVHLAWDTMLTCGFTLLGLAAWAGTLRLRRRDVASAHWFLRLTTISGALAIVALEAGWVVTEVGRQPWVVQGYLRTADAVTQAGGLQVSLVAVTILYIGLGAATIAVIAALSRRWRQERFDASDLPYGPTPR